MVALTDETGQVVQTYEYDSFGKIISQTGSIQNPLTYTGREYDEETGLYFYRARYYDPESGRFLTKDPIGFAAGDVNLYRYTRNNPINWVDALGLWSPGAHNAVLQYAFGSRLSSNDILRLQTVSRDFDARTLSASQSYMHSMRQFRQPAEEAIRLRDQFIENALAEARRLAQSGNRNTALDRFGEACHTIMDSSSPVHVDRNGNPRVWSRWLALGHSPNDTIGHETVHDLTLNILQSQRILLNNAYDRVFEP